MPPTSSSIPPTRVSLPELPAVDCPCGVARRWLSGDDRFPGTVHLTEITEAAKVHYHKRQTEVYVILQCQPGALIELNGQTHPVDVETAICIPPGVRHRAVGRMKVLIICTPDFDPDDEYFDEPS
ncbi:MAG: cupin domain-containing protein [Planctomycetota bacterium]